MCLFITNCQIVSCQQHMSVPVIPYSHQHLVSSVFFFLINLFIYVFIYLFLAALGLLCCTRAFSSCGERGPLFVAVRGLLIAVASLVAEHGF